MKVIEGKYVEQRLYLAYVFAVFRPGHAVPVFQAPVTPHLDAGQPSDLPDLELIVAEGRRCLDRQEQDLQRNHARATSLLTATLAELAFFAASLQRVFDNGIFAVLVWAMGVAIALLALLGVVAVLTTPAVYGQIDFKDLVETQSNRMAALAANYASSAGVGSVTNAARLTVMRDAAFLAVITGVLLLALIPFIGSGSEGDKDLPTCAPAVSTPCVLRSAPHVSKSDQ